jgi:prophage antirepressor-like protein
MKAGIIMNELQLFNFEDNEIQVFRDDNNDPWWYAHQVCKPLELSNTSQAVARLSDEDKQTITTNDSTSNNPNRIVINEPGLYDLVFMSRTEKSKRFKKWITHAVLPTIRITGAYSIYEDMIPKTLPEALELAASEMRKKERALEANKLLETKIEEDRPKVEAIDLLIATDTCVTWQQFTKSLKVKEGRNTILEYLRHDKILMKEPDRKNLPYDCYKHYFEIVQKPYPNGKGINLVTLVKPEGQVFLRKRLQKYLPQLQLEVK